MLGNNKKLLLLLVVLVGLFFITRWMKADKNVRNFKTELFTLDTTAVTAFSLYPKAENQEEIKFEKSNGAWTVSKGDVRSSIPSTQVSGMLNSLLAVKPKRLAARTKDKWKQYEVSDSLGTRLVLKNKVGKEMVDLMIGKFSYKQAPAQPGFNGQNNVSGLTYIRNSKEEETYATEGFLTMTFNREFNSFRDKTLLKCTPENVRRLSFESPMGNYTLNKMGNDWMLNDVKADSVAVATYFNQIKNINGNKIDDAYQASGNGDYRCTITGDNMEEIKLTAFAANGVFKLQSSMNPNTTYESDSTGVFSKLFKEQIDFLPEE